MRPPKTIVVATHNAGKLKEIQALLAPLSSEIVSPDVFQLTACPEPHATFVENALAKARHVCVQTGHAALADDSGLCVPALQGAPGVHSARYAGEPCSSARNNQKLLEALQHSHARAAYFYCVIVLLRHATDAHPLLAEGVWHGEILPVARGHAGFGYDSIFLDTTLGKSAAELDLAQKNQISHRGQALNKLLEQLML